MKISYLTLYPEFYDQFKKISIIKRAIDSKLVEMEFHNFKDYVKKGRVDDKIVSGGKGNLIRYDVALDALNDIKNSNSKVVLLTPKGKTFDQKMAVELAKCENLIFVCPHFEGIDERFSDEVDYQISIGDYILTGGELASQVVSDSVIRLLDGVINKDSLQEETFNDNLLEYGQYALPRRYDNKEIPEIYFSGNHRAIKEYRRKESLLLTRKIRPDLYKKHQLSEQEKKILKKCNKRWVKEIVSKSKNK